jgi:PAS domain S-box-containing protein
MAMSEPPKPSHPEASGSVPAPDASLLAFAADALPLAALTHEGVALQVSPALTSLFNSKPGTLDGVNLLDPLRHRDHSTLRAHLDRVIENREVSRCEVELILPDRTRPTVRMISRPATDGRGRTLCWTVFENLTQVKRMEKTEALYQRAVEIHGESKSLTEFAASVFDLLRRLFGVENFYCAITDPLTGQVTFPFFKDQKDPPPVPRDPGDGMTDYVITMGRLVWLHDARSGSSASALGFRILGTPPADWIGVPLVHRQKVAGMIAIQSYEPTFIFNAKDIGLMLGVGHLFEVFLDRMALQENQIRLSQAIEQAAETVVITDLHGVIQYVNPAFESITGYTAAEVIGQNPKVLNSGRHDAAFYRQMWETLSAGKTWHGRFVNRRKDGSLYEEEAVISPVRNDQGVTVNYVAVKRDVTREARLERQYLRAQRAKSISPLSANVAHELRDRLLVIQQGARQLVDGTLSDPAREGRMVLEAAEACEELLRHLTLFADDEPVVFDPTDLNSLVLGFETMARRLVAPACTLELDLSPRPARITASRVLVEQLLANLLLNAAEAMPDGGVISLRTGTETIDPHEGGGWVEPAPPSLSTAAVLEVVDQGPGIPRDIVPALFGLENNPDTPPAGQGLPACLDLMRRHEGTIQIRPASPNGARLRCLFPVTGPAAGVPPPPSPSAAIADPPSAPATTGDETVLIAEDEEGARRVMVRMLQDAGYTVLEAENGATAVRQILFHEGPVHLLLTDLMMPDFDGRALAEQIRGMRPDIKVLYISGYSESQLEDVGIKPGLPGVKLMRKPFRRDELLTAVRTALGTAP